MHGEPMILDYEGKIIAPPSVRALYMRLIVLSVILVGVLAVYFNMYLGGWIRSRTSAPAAPIPVMPLSHEMVMRD